MGADEVRRKVVAEWVAKAEDDVVGITRLLAEPVGCPTGLVCFCAQQCAEKYLKAVLVARAIDFPKVHDIERIVSLLPAGIRVPLTVEEQRQLTSYAVVSRYPGVGGPISLTEARRAVRLAKRVRAAVRKHLPKPAGRN
jgi:HEPN domain-containing protein